MNRKSILGYTMTELMIVLAITSILLGATIPLGSFWINNSRITFVSGELSHALGKAIGSALRNEGGRTVDEPAAAVCISSANDLTVLEATLTDTPSCSTSVGNEVWRTQLSDRVEITNLSNAVSCMCFTSRALLTTNDQCGVCLSSTQSSVDLSIGDKNETLFIH